MATTMRDRPHMQPHPAFPRRHVVVVLALLLLLGTGCLFPPPSHPDGTTLGDLDDEPQPPTTEAPDPGERQVERIVDRNVTLEGSIQHAAMVQAHNEVVKPQVHTLELEPRLVGLSVVVTLVDPPPNPAPSTDLDLMVNLTIQDPLGRVVVWRDQDVDGTVANPDEPSLVQRDRNVLERDIGSRLEITLESKAAVDQKYRVLVSYRYVETVSA